MIAFIAKVHKASEHFTTHHIAETNGGLQLSPSPGSMIWNTKKVLSNSITINKLTSAKPLLRFFSNLINRLLNPKFEQHPRTSTTPCLCILYIHYYEIHGQGIEGMLEPL